MCGVGLHNIPGHQAAFGVHNPIIWEAWGCNVPSVSTYQGWLKTPIGCKDRHGTAKEAQALSQDSSLDPQMSLLIS